MDAVREFRDGAEQSDDLTAVVLRFGGQAARSYFRRPP